MLSPPRTGPRTPAEHRAEPTRRAARHDSRQSIGTTRARPSTRGSTRRRAARHREAERPTSVPPRTDQTPHNNPAGHGSGTTDRLDGREEPEPTHRVPMTHRAARPTRAPPRRRAGLLPKSTQPRHDIHRTAVRPSCRETSTGERTAPCTQSENRARDQNRDHAGSDDNEHHRRSSRIQPAPQTARTASSHHISTTRNTTGRRAEDARRAASGADIQRDIRPARRRSTSWGSAAYDRTMRGSRTTRIEHDRNTPTRRETTTQKPQRCTTNRCPRTDVQARRPLAHLRRTDAERARCIIGRGGEQSAQISRAPPAGLGCDRDRGHGRRRDGHGRHERPHEGARDHDRSRDHSPRTDVEFLQDLIVAAVEGHGPSLRRSSTPVLISGVEFSPETGPSRSGGHAVCGYRRGFLLSGQRVRHDIARRCSASPSRRSARTPAAGCPSSPQLSPAS